MTYEQAIAYCKANRDKLVAECNAQNALAQRVVQMHQMHLACPSDPGASGLLISAVEMHAKVVTSAGS